MQHYPLYPNRAVTDLNGIWQFHFCENALLENVDENSFTPDDVMCVPGAFDTAPAYRYKRGTGLYRREFLLTEDSPRGLLKVGAIGLQARFCLDGKTVGTSKLPYSDVEFETGPLKAGRHVITAAIDNNLDPLDATFGPGDRMKIFLQYYDFYAFGGFYRGITLHQLAETALDRVQVQTLSLAEGKVALKFLFSGDTTQKQKVAFRFDTEESFHDLEVSHGDCVECMVPNFRIWTLEKPALHTLEVRCGKDCMVERFGIRTIAAGKKEILLNGKPVYLKGFNRHESHPEFGPATPDAVMLEDLQNLRDLNCNFVRGAHYSQDQRFLDLCDEMGMLVWEESLGWGNRNHHMGDQEFQALTEESTRLMVRNSINHPAVIIWGFMNEMSAGKPEAYQLSERLIKAIKDVDQSRLVTFACANTIDEICTPLMDIIAYNIYPGWLSIDSLQDPMDEIAPKQAQTIQFFREHNPADKPMIVSEMGCCALYGQRGFGAAQWTEEFQAEYLEKVIKTVASAKDELCGITIWQFNDAMSFHRKGDNIRGKPLGFNLAGVFDIYRRRKLSADAVKKLYAQL